MTLISCTLTGVDQQTDLPRIANLAATFPQAEFAILFSPERSGHQNRFPTFQSIIAMLDAGPTQWAIHLCGAAVPNFIRAANSGDKKNQDDEAFQLATHPAVSRIQLNFAFRRAKFSLPDLNQAIRFVSKPVITQEHGANRGVSLAIEASNHQILFDASGGRGIEATEWLPPLEGKICGFAGGLGLATLEGAFPAIRKVCAGKPFWIDMESRIRDQNDWFDLDACERALEISQTQMRSAT